MSLFEAIGITGSGIDAMQTWIDTSSGNIANSEDAVTAGSPTYAEQTPVFTPVPGQTGTGTGEGVEVSGVALGSSTGQLAHEPGNPIADTKGNVSLPNISLSDQLVQVMQAQQAYSADSSALARAVSAYQSGLTIGS